MQSRFIQANGLTFHIMESGEGKLILLLHGFPEFWYSWSKVMPLLAPHGKVVAVDMRGYGQSDKPPRVRDYHYTVLAKDVAEIIRALGYSSATVVGHDWGGGVAWEFVKLYPEMAERLVAINCPPAAVLQRSMLHNWQQFKKSWYVLFFQLPFLPEWRMHKMGATFFWRALRGWATQKDAFVEADIAKYVQAFSKPGDFTGPVHYYRAAARASWDKGFTQIPPIHTDTLIIWGEEDRALGPWLLDGLEQYFTGRFEIQRIPQCSHWVQQEQPKRTAEYIIQFLA